MTTPPLNHKTVNVDLKTASTPPSEARKFNDGVAGADPYSVPHFASLLEALNAVSNRPIATLDEVSWRPVSGGSINEAILLTLDGQQDGSQQDSVQLFLKQNRLDKADILTAEMVGLTAMQHAKVRTCNPLAIGSDTKRGRSFLLLSVIDEYQGSPQSATAKNGWQDLAHQLATLHKAMPPQPSDLSSKMTAREAQAKGKTRIDAGIHDKADTRLSAWSDAWSEGRSEGWFAGWFADNYIGTTPQYNQWTADWHEFFAAYRLAPQLKLAYDNQYVTQQTVQQIERLQHKLSSYLPNYTLTDSDGQPRPSLLHGDLWAGNAMLGHASKGGQEALGFLIDPAVYVGHPETDLAMTHLFGGFTADFYDAYAAQCPIDSEFTERVDIYNLYHYLNHLNLFGAGYLGAVQRIAQRFGR